MLAIEDGFAASLTHIGDGILDALDIFIERAAERDVHMVIPSLGDESDRVRLGVEQQRDAGIVGGRTPCPLGHAESCEFRLDLGARGEEFRVERIGAGIAAFHIINAELIEQRRDLALVFKREIDTGRLRAVAQRRIEKGETFAGHFAISFVSVVMPSHSSATMRVLRLCGM